MYMNGKKIYELIKKKIGKYMYNICIRIYIYIYVYICMYVCRYERKENIRINQEEDKYIQVYICIFIYMHIDV
jgi:hypothetical protein